MKKPTPYELNLFIKSWRIAQRKKSVLLMNELLQPKWLNCWFWSGLMGPKWNQTRDEAIKLILQQLNLIGR